MYQDSFIIHPISTFIKIFYNTKIKFSIRGIIMNNLFFYTGIFSTVILIIQVILTLIGIGIEGPEFDADMDFDDSDLDLNGTLDFSLFTFKSMVSFFSILSWTTLACRQAGLNYIVSILIGLLFGFITMYIVARIFFKLRKLKQDNTMEIGNAVGKIAKVYLTIPENKSGTGKVHINFDGILRELEAVSDEELKTNCMVEVYDILDNSILVVKKSI